MLLLVAVIAGAASSGGAEVDPNGPAGAAVWAASCLSPGTTELVVYGRGLVVGNVGVELTDQTTAVVGRAMATATARSGGAAFQARVPLSLAPTAVQLHLRVTQSGGTTDSPDALVVSPACSPTIAAVIDATPCASPGRSVAIAATVRGAPTSIYYAVVHHVDLYGPAEVVDHAQPARPSGDYMLSLSVPNVPDRRVPVTVEVRRADGSFAYATANVTLPPACGAPSTVTTGPPPSGPTSTATTIPPRPPSTPTAPMVPGSPFPFQAGRPGGGPGSLTLSPALGRAGEVTTVVGRGFAPSQPLTLRWRPGIGSWRVTAGGDGTFRTQVLVLPNDVEGPRVLEAQGAGPAPYLVVPSSEQPAFGGVFVRG